MSVFRRILYGEVRIGFGQSIKRMHLCDRWLGLAPVVTNRVNVPALACQWIRGPFVRHSTRRSFRRSDLAGLLFRTRFLWQPAAR